MLKFKNQNLYFVAPTISKERNTTFLRRFLILSMRIFKVTRSSMKEKLRLKEMTDLHKTLLALFDSSYYKKKRRKLRVGQTERFAFRAAL